MRRTFIILVAFVFCIPALGYGQHKSNTPDKINFSHLLTNGGQQMQGISNFLGLDPSRFSMQQSYMMSYGRYGGQNLSQGVYLNTMQYQISSPLTLQLQWGMAHNPMQSAGVPSALQSGLFISGASLQYKPSENTQIHLEFSSYPKHHYYNPMYSRSSFLDE